MSSALSFIKGLFTKNNKVMPVMEEDEENGIKFPGKIDIYTSVDILLIKIVSEAYTKDESRKPTMTFGNRTLHYKSDKSTSLWAHYEDEHNIILGVHGADDLELNLLALNEALSRGQEEQVFENFCDKYEELLASDKNVMIGGHSIGGMAIQKCYERHTKKLLAFTFAAYTPRLNTGWAQNATRKWVFTNDWLSNKQLQIGDPRNLHAITPKNALSFLNGHGLTGYLDQSLVNSGL